MGAAEKGPAEMKETRKRRFFQQVKEESADLRDAERNHHGQVNPRWRLNALRLWEGECGREGFDSFFLGWQTRLDSQRILGEEERRICKREVA